MKQKANPIPEVGCDQNICVKLHNSDSKFVKPKAGNLSYYGNLSDGRHRLSGYMSCPKCPQAVLKLPLGLPVFDLLPNFLCLKLFSFL